VRRSVRGVFAEINEKAAFFAYTLGYERVIKLSAGPWSPGYGVLAGNGKWKYVY